MSSDGGVGHGTDDTTSFVLQPPQSPQPQPQPQPTAQPYAQPRPVPAQQQDPGARLIGGRYRLAGRLGAGPTGTVWRALDEQEPDREVAVKEPLLPGDP